MRSLISSAVAFIVAWAKRNRVVANKQTAGDGFHPVTGRCVRSNRPSSGSFLFHPTQGT